MAKGRFKKIFPSWQNALLALAGAGLMILAFPDFEWWWTAWFALVPLMWAVEREKQSAFASFLLGWLFGTAYLFGTCWWLTYAPIHYAAVPWPLAYLMIFVACLLSGLFAGLFAAILARMLRRFGTWAFLIAPFVWVFTEFARYWLTGNDWNAIGYSQAFPSIERSILSVFLGPIRSTAAIGGVLLISYIVLLANAAIWMLIRFRSRRLLIGLFLVALALLIWLILFPPRQPPQVELEFSVSTPRTIAVQPNVPMSGLDQNKWQALRQEQIDLAMTQINFLRGFNGELPITVVLPESPMNFAYNDDREFQQFIGDFARRNGVSVLFNSSEPDKGTTRYFNSAVMVGPDGKKAAEYDKIYLLPFGEAVPFPFEGLMPAFVGQFAYGRNYTLLPVGDAKAGVMICFESHFGQLSRQYVRDGADVIIEMTNDGYLGPTPVLRQHLANAVFRAVETNRPVLRVTNVGITAYITETGQVLDPLPAYQEGTRVWSVSKSDGSQTFYVKYGDWFAWLCTIVTIAMIIFSFRRKREAAEARA